MLCHQYQNWFLANIFFHFTICHQYKQGNLPGTKKRFSVLWKKLCFGTDQKKTTIYIYIQSKGPNSKRKIWTVTDIQLQPKLGILLSCTWIKVGIFFLREAKRGGMLVVSRKHHKHGQAAELLAGCWWLPVLAVHGVQSCHMLQGPARVSSCFSTGGSPSVPPLHVPPRWGIPKGLPRSVKSNIPALLSALAKTRSAFLWLWALWSRNRKHKCYH